MGSRFENVTGHHDRTCVLSGPCTCRACTNHGSTITDETNTSASISRIVLLAEALFEVTTCLHLPHSLLCVLSVYIVLIFRFLMRFISSLLSYLLNNHQYHQYNIFLHLMTLWTHLLYIICKVIFTHVIYIDSHFHQINMTWYNKIDDMVYD